MIDILGIDIELVEKTRDALLQEFFWFGDLSAGQRADALLNTIAMLICQCRIEMDDLRVN